VLGDDLKPFDFAKIKIVIKRSKKEDEEVILLDR
jgi:hypothetical protein